MKIVLFYFFLNYLERRNTDARREFGGGLPAHGDARWKGRSSAVVRDAYS